MKKTLSREEFMGNQIKLNPCFMEPNGRCFYCGFDIARDLASSGHDGKDLVTGCHKCNRSFCA